MKTWTNPIVEELDVKNTAYYYAWWQVEEANGKLDDSLLWGTDDDNSGNSGNSGNQGNEGNTGNEGSGEDEGGFGNES